MSNLSSMIDLNSAPSNSSIRFFNGPWLSFSVGKLPPALMEGSLLAIH